MKVTRLLANRHNFVMLLVWLCAVLFAATQAHFFLYGYRLTGDDVLFENVVLHGKIADYIVQTAAQQARIGMYVLLPILLLGSQFADHLLFRVAYVALWYADILLFSFWLARVSRVKMALPVFVAIVALQPMIGYHMPPVGYPLELALPLMVLMASRLVIVRGRPVVVGSRSIGSQLLMYLTHVFYLLALISSEYMMIVGLVLVACEISTARSADAAQPLGNVLKRYRGDLISLAVVYFAYAYFRQSQASHYDGASMDGLGHLAALGKTFAMHIASGTWLPFFQTSVLAPPAVRGALAAAVLCFFALCLYERANGGNTKLPKRSRASAVVLALGVVAITLPVVSAEKQQQWCLINHNCSYLDSRISLLFLVGSVALLIVSLAPNRVAKVSLKFFMLATLTVSAGLGYAVAVQQTQGMRIANSAWERARKLACAHTGLSVAQASRLIDPNHYIPMHSIMDRDMFWSDYMNRMATEQHCATPSSGVPIIGNHLPVGTAELVRADGPGSRFISTGWSHIEPSGVWSDGNNALIETILEPSGQPLRLMLVLQAYDPASHGPQVLQVKINGVKLTSWTVAADVARAYAVDIPEQLSRSGGPLLLQLEIGHPTSPLENHQSSDPRKLGVFLSSLMLEVRASWP
ncbi:hypothetical protein [Rhodanobacter sp. BL-MT-08]